MISLSVIIPCYNAERFISECIRSVRNQTLRDIQIILIDDGSTDGTGKIIKRWKLVDHRIRAIFQQNKGVSSARNTGLRAAEGQFVYFLDSDDTLFDTDVMAQSVTQMRDNSLDILVGGAQTVYESKVLEEQYPDFETRYQIKHTYPDSHTGQEAIHELRSNREWSVPPGTKLFRRDFLQQNHLEFLEGYIHEDGLFTFQCLILAQKVQITNNCFYSRRIREQSIMTSPVTHKNALGYIEVLKEEIRFLEKHRDICIPDVTIGRSLITAKQMAIRTYNKLDEHEKKLLHQSMNDEQRFYFEAFVKNEANLMEKSGK